MNPREAGFLLLTCPFGRPDRQVLTLSQLRILTQRMTQMEKPVQDRDLERQDLVDLGYTREMADRILTLLEDTQALADYVEAGARQDCYPLTRVSGLYPKQLLDRLGGEAPGCLWIKGDRSLLDERKIALVGSRDLNPENQDFAREVGRQAALQGYVLVSGNARGADREAQDACLACGGRVISVVADELRSHPLSENVLYISEEGFAQAFSSQRALSRNRLIHAMAEKTFVAQASLHKGGSWDGAVRNLQHRWSPVFVFRDESRAMQELEEMGASPVGCMELENLAALTPDQQRLTDFR